MTSFEKRVTDAVLAVLGLAFIFMLGRAVWVKRDFDSNRAQLPVAADRRADIEDLKKRLADNDPGLTDAQLARLCFYPKTGPRARAVSNLGRRGGVEAFNTLLMVLRTESDWHVRWNAAQSFFWLRSHYSTTKYDDRFRAVWKTESNPPVKEALGMALEGKEPK